MFLVEIGSMRRGYRDHDVLESLGMRFEKEIKLDGEHSTLEGELYQFDNESTLQQLDAYKGYPRVNTRVIVGAINNDGDLVDAIMYQNAEETNIHDQG